MLVTFTTKAYADITMFGEAAIDMLKMMGLSGTVPSALRAEDVPPALARLKSAIAKREAEAQAAPAATTKKGDEEEPEVSLSHRALPLVALLEAAASQRRDVTWDKGWRVAR